ncbi:MAG: TolB family protein [Sandaracinaceae bacterium]
MIRSAGGDALRGCRRHLGAWAIALLLGSGCAPAGFPLLVQIRTDLVPGSEFDGIAVSIDGQFVETHVSLTTEDYVTGIVIAQIDDVAPGTHMVRAGLSRDGVETIAREVLVEVRVATATTVLITRDCRGVSCPGNDPTATACLGGRCVTPSCTPETPEACPMPQCVDDADCVASVGCATGRCAGGACLYEGNGSCGPGLFCDGSAGCVPSGGCDAWSEWSTPVRIDEVSSSETDWGAWISPDALELWFVSDRRGQFDVYRTTRPDRMSGFDPPDPVEDLNTMDDEDDIELSADRLELYFARGVRGVYTLYVARRESRDEPFGTPIALAINRPAQAHIEPALSGDDLELVYSQDAVVGSGIDFFRSVRPRRDADFEVGERIEELSGMDEQQCCPGLSPDGLEIYFPRKRGIAANDIYRAVRQGVSMPFSRPTVATALSQAGAEDLDPTISRDGTTMVMSSGRGGTTDLYISMRSCL